MLKEQEIKVLPQRLRKIVCDICGRVHFAPRYYSIGQGYPRSESTINVECCGWKMYGKGYDKELKTCQIYTH
jgi:hypothetical protein